MFIRNMAKPIRSTPTLKGEDAKHFVRKMLEEQKHPSKERIDLLKEARRVKFNS